MISLPDFDNPQGPQPFRLKLNATRETLEFQQIAGNVANRDSKGQNDINIFGLTYLQRISDSLSSGRSTSSPVSGSTCHRQQCHNRPPWSDRARFRTEPRFWRRVRHSDGQRRPKDSGRRFYPFRRQRSDYQRDLSGALWRGHVAARFSTTVPQEPEPGSGGRDPRAEHHQDRGPADLDENELRAVLYRRWGAEHPPLSRSFLLSFRE